MQSFFEKKIELTSASSSVEDSDSEVSWSREVAGPVVEVVGAEPQVFLYNVLTSTPGLEYRTSNKYQHWNTLV